MVLVVVGLASAVVTLCVVRHRAQQLPAQHGALAASHAVQQLVQVAHRTLSRVRSQCSILACGLWLIPACAAAHLDDGHQGAGSDEGHDDDGDLGGLAQLAQDGAAAEDLGASAGQEACGTGRSR